MWNINQVASLDANAGLQQSVFVDNSSNPQSFYDLKPPGQSPTVKASSSPYLWIMIGAGLVGIYFIFKGVT